MSKALLTLVINRITSITSGASVFVTFFAKTTSRKIFLADLFSNSFISDIFDVCCLTVGFWCGFSFKWISVAWLIACLSAFYSHWLHRTGWLWIRMVVHRHSYHSAKGEKMPARLPTREVSYSRQGTWVLMCRMLDKNSHWSIVLLRVAYIWKRFLLFLYFFIWSDWVNTLEFLSEKAFLWCSLRVILTFS